MELIFGGAYQGKLDYAKEKYNIDEDAVFYCKDIDSCDTPDEAIALLQPVKTIQRLEARSGREIRIINNFENFVYANVVNNLNPLTYISENEKFFENKIVILTDISQGVVPMQQDLRTWRDTNGRVMAQLAKKATSVTRIFCGLPQVLK